MQKKLSLKNHFFESQLYLSRLMIAMGILGFLSLILLGRLLYLQWVEHTKYSTLSDQNRILLSPTEPNRGLILDRNGVILAENKSFFNLEIILEKTPNLAETISRLKQILPIPETDLTRFHKLIKQKKAFEPIPIYTKLTETDLITFAENRHFFPGVDIAVHLLRYYPFKTTFSHVLGYVGRINESEKKLLDEARYRGALVIGKSGLEKYYETSLRGETGFQAVEINAEGKNLRVLKNAPPKAGKTLTLTIDARLQTIAENAFQNKKGAAVGIDPTTGEILVFFSNPGFDPNLFATGIDTESYQALQHSPSRPLFDRALRGRYPPGSTIKPFVALAGLESGIITPDFSIDDPGFYQLSWQKHRFRDWRPEGHGKVNLDKAITESCDTYFYQLAQKLGIDTLQAFLTPFAFGKRIGVDTVSEAKGLLPGKEWKKRVLGKPWYPGETLIAGIGQGFMLSTPLQLAASTSLLASRGLSFKPHFLKHQNAILKHGNMTLKNHENWDIIINAMKNSVHTPMGTAWKMGQTLPFEMAGKTGTSQVFTIGQHEKYQNRVTHESLKDHGLFICFAPLANPKIALAVIVENGGSGSALPIAKAILEGAL